MIFVIVNYMVNILNEKCNGYLNGNLRWKHCNWKFNDILNRKYCDDKFDAYLNGWHKYIAF